MPVLQSRPACLHAYLNYHSCGYLLLFTYKTSLILYPETNWNWKLKVYFYHFSSSPARNYWDRAHCIPGLNQFIQNCLIQLKYCEKHLPMLCSRILILTPRRSGPGGRGGQWIAHQILDEIEAQMAFYFLFVSLIFRPHLWTVTKPSKVLKNQGHLGFWMAISIW